MVTCPVCGSEEVYRGLKRRKRFWLCYLVALIIPPVITLTLILPLFDDCICLNCGVILA